MTHTINNSVNYTSPFSGLGSALATAANAAKFLFILSAIRSVGCDIREGGPSDTLGSSVLPLKSFDCSSQFGSTSCVALSASNVAMMTLNGNSSLVQVDSMNDGEGDYNDCHPSSVAAVKYANETLVNGEGPYRNGLFVLSCQGSHLTGKQIYLSSSNKTEESDLGGIFFYEAPTAKKLSAISARHNGTVAHIAGLDDMVGSSLAMKYRLPDGPVEVVAENNSKERENLSLVQEEDGSDTLFALERIPGEPESKVVKYSSSSFSGPFTDLGSSSLTEEVLPSLNRTHLLASRCFGQYCLATIEGNTKLALHVYNGTDVTGSLTVPNVKDSRPGLGPNLLSWVQDTGELVVQEFKVSGGAPVLSGNRLTLESSNAGSSQFLQDTSGNPGVVYLLSNTTLNHKIVEFFLPTAAPTATPTEAPTLAPTTAPTRAPTTEPTAPPVSGAPTPVPTPIPTSSSLSPTSASTSSAPTGAPTTSTTLAPNTEAAQVPVQLPEAPEDDSWKSVAVIVSAIAGATICAGCGYLLYRYKKQKPAMHDTELTTRSVSSTDYSSMPGRPKDTGHYSPVPPEPTSPEPAPNYAGLPSSGSQASEGYVDLNATGLNRNSTSGQYGAVPAREEKEPTKSHDSSQLDALEKFQSGEDVDTEALLDALDGDKN